MDKYVFLNANIIFTRNHLNKKNVSLLRKFVDISNTEVILISEFEDCTNNFLNEELEKIGVEIVRNIDIGLSNKGYSVFKFLEENSYDAFIIFDNSSEDYEKYELDSHLIEVLPKTGLKVEDVLNAMQILDLQKSFITVKETENKRVHYDA